MECRYGLVGKGDGNYATFLGCVRDAITSGSAVCSRTAA